MTVTSLETNDQNANLEECLIDPNLITYVQKVLGTSSDHNNSSVKLTLSGEDGNNPIINVEKIVVSNCYCNLL